ncbi:MAG TPA: gamma-glutamyltransferase family protein [Acetobacteraceae bacterium]|jgi:gamma-glutamyltranspeptidase/glutathione hydrolase|nr:gamma-glutamyltransferase family protein [Acetobacteraceae bacterium]
MTGPIGARRHIVATAHPLASAAADDVLREGGTAVDAAIAAQTVLGVVEPHASGLAGGSLLLVWTAADRRLAFIEGLAQAPEDVPEDWVVDARGVRIPKARLERCGRVVGVPGTPRTLALAHRRYGRLPWARLFRDAIRLADEGFALAPYLHATLRQRPELAGKAAFARPYFDANGKPLAAGAMLRSPELAGTMRRIAADGAEAVHGGPIAASVIAAVRGDALPGGMTQADLDGYAPQDRDPVELTLFGHRICTAAPPVSGGIALLQQLAILERLGIADEAPGSAEAAHLMIEAGRVARADRRRWIGDPDQAAVPVAGLLESGYLDGRAGMIARRRALDRVRAGMPPGARAPAPSSEPLGQTATSHVSVIDGRGDAVSFTTTINQAFGSDLIASGMVLNDALTNFATRPVRNGRRVANAIAPRKRPITTMAPTIVFGADGRPVLALGAGGGARIIDSVAQTIVGVLAWGWDIRTAISAPRVGAQNGLLELERGTKAAALAPALRAMGHAPEVVEMNAGVQAVAADADGVVGWADPRRDGDARGG